MHAQQMMLTRVWRCSETWCGQSETAALWRLVGGHDGWTKACLSQTRLTTAGREDAGRSPETRNRRLRFTASTGVLGRR